MKCKTLLLFLIPLFINGCARPVAPLKPHAYLTPSQQTLAHRLRRYGVFTHQQGTKLWVVIPTDVFFAPGSTELYYDRIAPIADVATLIRSYQRHYPGSSIKVMGFKNPKLTGPSARNTSRPFAKALTRYLKNFGVTLRIKTTTGNTKTSPTGLIDDDYSRRVIISVNA